MDFGEHPNTLSLYDLISNPDFALKYSIKINIIYKSIICDKCNREMIISSNKSFSYCYCFYCKCGNKKSITAYSYFMYSKITMNKEYHLLYCWANQYLCQQTKKETGVNKNTITQRFQQLREVCIEYIINNDDNQFIGGNNKTVEIDETCISHRKYNCGRMTNEVWVFGGICREDGNIFAIVVPDRTKETLMNELRKHVLPDTIIHSDSWKAYGGIKKYFKDHLQVNHSENFVDPITKCNTQRIERLWKEIKTSLSKYNGVKKDSLNQFIAEFIWRRNEVKFKNIDPFYAILDLLIKTKFIPME